MIVDSSALIAMALDAPEATHLAPVLLADPTPRISAGNLLETYMVIDRRWGDQAAAVVARVVTPLELIVEPVTEAQVAIARCLAPIWPGQQTPGAAELRRLFRLRAGAGAGRAAAVCGQRLLADRHEIGAGCRYRLIMPRTLHVPDVGTVGIGFLAPDEAEGNLRESGAARAER